jgi:hypothetical protein
MKNRIDESGQAFAELLISMFAIMVVFVGVLFTGALGMENIKCSLAARSQAAKLSAMGSMSGDRGDNILSWDYGDDELYFTRDDASNRDIGGETGIFAREYTSTNDEFSLVSDLRDVDRDSTYNFTAAAPGEKLFLWAANLTSYQETIHDPFATRELDDLKSAFRMLVGDPNSVSLSDKVYLPKDINGY